MRRQHHARCRVVAGDVGGEQVQQSVRRVVVCLNSGPEPEEKGSAAESSSGYSTPIRARARALTSVTKTPPL